MNRHERRAQEARTRKDYADYSNLYRAAFKRAGEREIGEGYMRGAKAEAEGIAGMILHAPGDVPPQREACDLQISAAYKTQNFTAYAEAKYAPTLEREWVEFTDTVRHHMGKLPGGDDMRAAARGLVLEMLVTNEPMLDGDMAALMAAAIVWLARTSPVGALYARAGKAANAIHYEITDEGPAAPPGSGGKNFRLMMG